LSELADKVEKEAEKKLPPPEVLIPAVFNDDQSTPVVVTSSSNTEKPAGWKDKLKGIFKKSKQST